MSEVIYSHKYVDGMGDVPEGGGGGVVSTIGVG